MDHRAGVAGKVVGRERRDVADRAVDDIAFGFAPLRDVLHDLADQRAGLVAAAIDHDDVAGADQLERAVDGEIVAGTGADREGRAHQLAAAVIGLSPTAPGSRPRLSEMTEVGAPRKPSMISAGGFGTLFAAMVMVMSQNPSVIVYLACALTLRAPAPSPAKSGRRAPPSSMLRARRATACGELFRNHRAAAALTISKLSGCL